MKHFFYYTKLLFIAFLLLWWYIPVYRVSTDKEGHIVITGKYYTNYLSPFALIGLLILTLLEGANNVNYRPDEIKITMYHTEERRKLLMETAWGRVVLFLLVIVP